MAKSKTPDKDAAPERSPEEHAVLNAFPQPPEGIPQSSHNPETDARRGKTARRIFGEPQ